MRLYKRAKTWWIYDRTIPGSHRRSLDTTNKKVAREKAEALTVNIYKQNMGMEAKALPVNIKIEIFKTKIIRHIEARYSKRTIETYIMRLNNFLNWLKIDKSQYRYINQVKRIDVEEFITFRRQKISTTTANNDITALKAIFYKGIKLEMLQKNPFVGIDALPSDSKPPHYYKNNEIISIFQNISDNYRSHFVVLLHTGIRKGELMHLEWSDIYFDKKYIHIRPHGDRTQRKMKPRIIPMHDEVVKALKIRKRLIEVETKLVFANSEGGMLAKNTVYRVLQSAKAKAGVKKGNIHSFRHTFATNLLAKGVSIKIVKELLGHEKIETTEIYAHLDVNEFRPLLNISLNFNI